MDGEFNVARASVRKRGWDLTILRIDMDMSSLELTGKELLQLQDSLSKSANMLAAQAHMHIVESVQDKLRSRRELFLKNLTPPQPVNDGYVIILKHPAVWIDDGMPQHSMVQDLLRKSPYSNAKSSPKTSKTGNTYRIIPFDQNRAPTRLTPAELTLKNSIKTQMKKFW